MVSLPQQFGQPLEQQRLAHEVFAQSPDCLHLSDDRRIEDIWPAIEADLLTMQIAESVAMADLGLPLTGR